MKQFEKKSLQFNEWSDYCSFEVPTYSKLLDVYLSNNLVTILYEYDSTNYYNMNKRFNLKVIKEEGDLRSIPSNYDFLKTITIEEPQRIETLSTFSGVNFNLSPLNKKVFLIFFNELKPIEENRDEKIAEVLNESKY
jgi:hypothetical protein